MRVLHEGAKRGGFGDGTVDFDRLNSHFVAGSQAEGGGEGCSRACDPETK
jgi:hypothetical protein